MGKSGLSLARWSGWFFWCLLGIAQGLFGRDGDEAVEDRLRPLRPCQRRPHHLECRNLAGTDAGGNVGGGGVGNRVDGHGEATPGMVTTQQG